MDDISNRGDDCVEIAEFMRMRHDERFDNGVESVTFTDGRVETFGDKDNCMLAADFIEHRHYHGEHSSVSKVTFRQRVADTVRYGADIHYGCVMKNTHDGCMLIPVAAASEK